MTHESLKSTPHCDRDRTAGIRVENEWHIQHQGQGQGQTTNKSTGQQALVTKQATSTPQATEATKSSTKMQDVVITSVVCTGPSKSQATPTPQINCYPKQSHTTPNAKRSTRSSKSAVIPAVRLGQIHRQHKIKSQTQMPVVLWWFLIWALIPN